MLYDQRRKRSRQSMSAVPRAPASSRPTAAAPALPAPPLVRAHAATSRFLEALPRHSRHDPVWGSSHARVRSVLTTTAMARTDQERVASAASADADADASRSPRSSSTVADSSSAVVVTTHEESAMVHSPSPFELQQRADVRKLIRHAHRARKLLLDRLTIVNLRRNHRCELMEEIARLKKVLASLQEQVDTTTRNVATMDRLVQHLQTISSIFTDAIQVPEATSSALASAPAASIGTAESVALTPDTEPKSPGSSRQSSSPRSPGAVTADDPLVIVQVEEEEEGSKEEQRREEKEKEQEEEDAQE